MKKFLTLGLALPCAAALVSTASAQLVDVTKPGDTIVLVNGTNDTDGDAGGPPAAEGVEHVIDNVGQKYLNFLDLGSGFAVAPSIGSTLVTGLRFYTANDAVERDPASYLLEGSSSLNGTWTTIAAGDLALPEGRNNGGNAALGGFFQEVYFDNGAAFEAYRLTFPTLKNAGSANSMQISEVEFLGVAAVPEPSTIGLLGLAGVAGMMIRRRK